MSEDLVAMDEAVLDSLMSEIEMDNPTLIEDKLTEETAGTPWEKVAQTGKSVFYTIIKALFWAPWTALRASIRKLIPMLWWQYATGAWLNEHLKSRGMEWFMGKKSQFTLTLIKEELDSFTVQEGDVFYVKELVPRKYKALADSTFESGTECLVLVEAEEVGSRYNVGANMISETEESYPITSITHSVEPDVYGADVDDDEVTRERIRAHDESEDESGTDPFYIAVLKTVEQVLTAELVSVEANGVMTYSIYGQSGLDQTVVDEAQVAVDAKKMKTDTIIVVAAEAQELPLTIMLEGTYDQVQVNDETVQFFVDLARGNGFESSQLSQRLYDKFPLVTNLRITPQFATPDAGKFFLPVTTIEDYV